MMPLFIYWVKENYIIIIDFICFVAFTCGYKI